MNSEQLKYIVEVAKSGSISKASKGLFITQSAISQSITNLEKELGIKIFIRSRNGAKPTEIGNKIIQKAIETLEKMEEINIEVANNNEWMAGELRLGTIPSPLMHLTKTLASFKKDYPRISMKVSEMSSETIIDAIVQEKLDIGLVGLSMGGGEFHNKDIDMKVVLRGKMVVAVGKHSKFAFCESITTEEIQDQLLVIYEDERMWEFVEAFIPFKREPNILFSTNNTDAIRNAVMEDLAITIAPDYTIYNDPYVLGGQIIPLKIANIKQDYPGMALVRLKSSQNKVANHFSHRLEEDISRLKERPS